MCPFRNIRFTLVLIILAIIQHKAAAVRQNPLKNPQICGRPQCDLTTHKFGYGEKIYKYEYTTEIHSEFSGTGQNSSDLYLNAKLELVFPKPCEGFLRIIEARFRDHEDLGTTKGSEQADQSIEEIDNKGTDDYYGEFGTDKETEEIDYTKYHPKTLNLNTDLKKYTLRFAFHDGLISEVCSDKNEPIWVLNLKKGMLSTFQNTMMRFDVDSNTKETDVSGVCEVQYLLQSTDSKYVTINKVKDIASCTNRYATQSVLQSTPYTFRDDKTTLWPVLKSESHCNMTIDQSIYREISCFERHQLVPFSNGSTGAVTITHSKFLLIDNDIQTYDRREFLEAHDQPIARRTTLLFDHTPNVRPTHGELNLAKDMLKQMCSLGFPIIQRTFIEVFSKFLQITKNLDYKALGHLLAQSNSICETGKKHVLESLPYIGSVASYQLMRDEIIGNTIPKNVANGWMTSLAFIERPDEQTLDTFYAILEFAGRKSNPEYTLGATAVIHSYCRHHENCAENEKVSAIVKLLESEFLSLFNMYQGERHTRERMIIILKSLGNIGVLSEAFAEQLQGIIAVENLAPIEIRLQSVLAFRRVDCHKYRAFFLEYYGNFKINPEIRIFSFIQGMRCPDYLTVHYIKTILDQEDINQVGSFVWSYLKNLVTSSSPLKIEIQGLLLNEDFGEKFKLDIRKFSRNYEHSLFFDEYNFGSTTDMNVIFGTESYLPRATNLNFTAHLFGKSVNFFEFSARAEGFENLIKSTFGPKGPWNSKNVLKKLSFINRWIGDESSEDTDTLENLLSMDSLRLKRDTNSNTANDANEDEGYEYEAFNDENLRQKRATTSESKESRNVNFKKNIDNYNYKLKYDYNKPSAQIGLRLFGNDLRHYSVEGILEVMALSKEFDPFYQVSKILSGNDVVYTKSRVFLDASYNAPLGNGLPLAIHVFGASSIDLRISGNLKRLTPQKPDWYFDVEAKLKPSISVDIITTMNSDMYYASSGIKVQSNLYSNSEVEAKLKVRGENEVKFEFSLPQDKSEIFSARSELLVLQQSEEKPQEGIKKRSSNSTCTWPVLNDALGLKICTHYSVPDVSNTTDVIYPGLLLSGPLNFSIIMTKFDLTAKNYVFEYKWDKHDIDSKWSLVFHTPRSAIKRQLVANVTRTLHSLNATLAFEHDKSSLSAGCTYDGNPNQRKLDVFLYTNGNRSLDLSMELLRWQERSVTVFKPKVLLTVNGVNVTGLVGVIKRYDKNDIVQNDFELSFETRKVQALVRGNFVQTEITTSTNVTAHYRFQTNTIETINFEGKLINHGDKAKTEYRGNVKLSTSAHPKLNFHSNATWLSMKGHTEGVLTYNNGKTLANPAYNSQVRLVLVHTNAEGSIWDGPKTWVSFELRLPKSNIDFGISAKHDKRFKNGTEHNVILDFRYARDKEANAIFSVHFPQRNLFAVDAYMNITIPDFNSTTARLKVTERLVKDYMINFNGCWFTGHTMAIKGNYKDRSSRVQAHHLLKMVVESPSFEITSVNIVYRRNQFLIYADLQAKYDKDPYGLLVQYTTSPVNKSTDTKVQLKILDKDYSLTGKLLLEQPKLLELEIHLDRVRDIQIKLGMLTIENRKEISLEFKWDANRDPSQRLGLLLEYNNPAFRIYNGDLMITYPERTISCGFQAYTGGPTYNGKARVSWNVGDIIQFSYDAGLLPGSKIHNWLNAELTTPFVGWQHNSLSSGVYSAENLILANTSLLWANNQSFMIGYKSDYFFGEAVTSFEVRMDLNSTIKDVPTLGVFVKHWQDLTKFDTELDLRYSGVNESLNVYMLKSYWELSQNRRFQNISGTMLMMSPFEKYKKGGLAAKLSFSEDHELLGAAALNFDLREFNLAIDGYANAFTDNMLEVNITTPLEKFRTIHGRLGLNEYKRYAVAEILAPHFVLGAEVLCDIKSLTNFDIKLSVATPIENLTRAAVFAKIKTDTVDLRGLWNNSTLGFTGVWYMNNELDFEYSYRVFTPLPGFENNGFIVKFNHRDIFILDLYGKLASYELGVRVNGHKKSKLFNQLGGNKIELEFLYDSDFPKPVLEEGEDYELTDEDYKQFLSYYIDFQLHTLVWPKIDGLFDIQEMLDYYVAYGNIRLPQGAVEIKNRLYFPDYLKVLNVMNINTPFNVSKNIKILFGYHCDLYFTYFNEKLHFFVDNALGETKEMAFTLNYTKQLDALKPKDYIVRLSFRTPFQVLKEIDIMGQLEFEEHFYRSNISAETTNTYLSFAVVLESEENFLETSAGMILDSKIVPYYGYQVHFKKDFSNIENIIEMQIDVDDNHVSRKVEFKTNWRNEQSGYYNLNGKLTTTFLPLKQAEFSAFLVLSEDPLLNCYLIITTESRLDYGLRAEKQKDVFNIDVWSPIKNYHNMSMHGSITSQNPKKFYVTGQLYHNMITHDLEGYIYTDQGFSLDLSVDKSIKINLDVVKDQESGNGKKISFTTNAGTGKYLHITGKYAFKDETGLEYSAQVNSSEIQNLMLEGQIQLKPANGKLGRVTLEISQGNLFGLSSIKVHTDMDMNFNHGYIECDYHIHSCIGHGIYAWTLVPEEEVRFLLESKINDLHFKPRTSHVSLLYLNPNRNLQNLVANAKMNVDNLWNLELNSSSYFSRDDAQITVITKLPQPVGDTHTLNARYRGNWISQQLNISDLFFEGKYLSTDAKQKFLTRVTYRNLSDTQGLGRVEWGKVENISQVEGSFQILRKAEVRREFFTKLLTPKFKSEDTLFLSGTYDLSAENYHLIKCNVNYPASNRIAETDFAFQTLSNMYGFVNTTTPFVNLTWLKADVEFSNCRDQTNRYVRGSWPNDFVLFKLENMNSSEDMAHINKGKVHIEVPFANRHNANITYELSEKQFSSNGIIEVMYNGEQVLKGKYTQNSTNINSIYEETTDITLENELKPLGIHYMTSSDYTSTQLYPLKKHIEIFELGNSKNFNLTGELHMNTSQYDQNMKIFAIHTNRTVILTTDYHEIEHQAFKQRSKLELSPTVWIGYNIENTNTSKSGNNSKSFKWELFYPSRNLSADGWYYHTNEEFDSNVAFKWNIDSESETQKQLRSGFLWHTVKLRDGDLDHQKVLLKIEHPNLEKDVNIRGSYYRGLLDMLRAEFTVDYSNDPKHLIKVETSLKNLTSEIGHKMYTFLFNGEHKASELSCQFNGSSIGKPLYYKIFSDTTYKREYFPDKQSKFVALLDLNKKEIEYLSQSPYRSVRLWYIPNMHYPIYGFNATILDSEDTYNNGYVYIDVHNKLACMDFNLSEDASQNLQMYGYIPDSRSAFLDIWRNYEEIRIVDVSSYIKMNHSRLVTGRFHWRPQLKKDIKNKIYAIGSSLNNSVTDGVDFWIKSLYSETLDAVNLVWATTKEYNQGFFDDINGLSVLEQDLENLRHFINSSYEANDFEIKTVVNFTLTVLDELAIRDHIASLPLVFTEMWHAMGDTGKALRNSIFWLIDTVKNTYNNMLEIISRFFHGESLQYVSNVLEKGVEKYDKFIKELHIKFIKYMEKLNQKVLKMLEDYWKYILMRIEPHVFKFLSMVESAAWDLSKEVFDFIYKRTNELAESPYFNKVSSFTQDVDRLYKDIKAHDAITNIRKYSAIAWNFIKEKYMKLLPFGTEMNEVFTEIFNEIKELQKIDQVAIIVQKYNEVVAKLEWIAEELQLERRLQQLYVLMVNRLSYFTQNALETADMYREAKTKFIYDPEVGEIDLEQKLPMSWHAFNETPKFEEIPEYRFLLQTQNVFSNFSFIHYIYNLRNNLDTKTWLPPYPSNSLIIDSRHFMTFDDRYVSLTFSKNPQCDYLLAHDFYQNNFTLILEQSAFAKTPSKINKKLSFVAQDQLFEIDLEKDRLTINGRGESMLPLMVQELQVHREMDILTIESTEGYKLVCNLQFHLCSFEVAGWYFGRTAGLLGTMNNEHYDDFMTPRGELAPTVEQFTEAWKINKCRQGQQTDLQLHVSPAVLEICEELFKSGIFATCASAVDPLPFYELCLDLGETSSALHTGHPAIKGACTTALAYIEACHAVRLPMRVPSQCVYCALNNGSYVTEGTQVELQGDDVPYSSDIVFIVEAKPCNANLIVNKSIMTVVTAIEQELQQHKIINNRYAVVTFGGRKPFDVSHTIVHDNKVFTEDHQRLQQYFQHIKVHNGSNNDVLQAISHTFSLPYRAGVSKNFILLLCSDCSSGNMRFDYGSILQYMRVEGANLHILADTEFEFEHTRKLRHILGLDRDMIYSKRSPDGDADTRKQLHITKNNLGICMPLALETDGSVFSVRKFMPEKKYPIKRLAHIFAKRLVKTARSHLNQSCECSAHNSGVAFMACSPKQYSEEIADVDYDAQYTNLEFEDVDELEV